MTTKHLNLRWTIADIDTAERMARNRATTTEIARKLKASRKEVTDLCQRHGFKIFGAPVAAKENA